tara:strand:- start:270 stop:422 length:153 start_codon:yes stop_codon:yes gene_type:complete
MPQGKGTYGSQVGRPKKKMKKLAAAYGNPNKVTRGDIITMARKNKLKIKK